MEVKTNNRPPRKCCGLSLQRSIIILGVAGAICSIIYLSGVTFNDVLHLFKQQDNYTIEDESESFQLPLYHSVYMVYALLNLIACLLLIIGATMDRHCFLRPWITVNAIAIIVLILGPLMALFETLANMCLDLLLILLSIYCWAVACVVYGEIKKKLVPTVQCAAVEFNAETPPPITDV